MIHRVSSTLNSFKSVEFHDGLNILLADRKHGRDSEADKTKTRNSVGKSSLVSLIDFLLGSSAKKNECIFRLDALSDYTFSMEFDLGDGTICISRSGAKYKTNIIQGNVSNWPDDFISLSEERRISIPTKDWTTVLGLLVFGLPESLPKYSPTFRLLFPYFCRIEDVGGFKNATATFAKSNPWQEQVAMSVFLGLDWDISRNFQEWRERKKEMQNLSRLAKRGELGEVVGTAAEIRPQANRAEQRVTRLRRAVETFKVLPEYKIFEKKASRIKKSIDDLSKEKTSDLILLEQLEASILREAPPDTKALLEVYNEAGVVFPDAVRQRFEDVKVFHESILGNRKVHLQAEISSAHSRVAQRDRQMKSLDYRRSELMDLLHKGGALEQLTSLQTEIGKQESHLETLRHKLKLVKQIETSQLDLKADNVDLQRKLKSDLEDREEITEEALAVFQDIAERLYGEEAKADLKIEPESTGLKVTPSIRGTRGGGIRNMLIFCFDLMLMKLSLNRGIGLKVLVHDSHLFDGVDTRQVATALETAARYARENGFQYIVTMNSDKFNMLSNFSDDFDINEYVLETRLTDDADGGLFGFRFE